MGVGHHAFDDEKDTLDQPEVCRRNQIRRVDAGQEATRTSFYRIARGQKAHRRCARSVHEALAESSEQGCREIDGQACEGSGMS